MTKRIVITGGPGTGKTFLVRELEKAGYQCYHEVIREMTSSVIAEAGTSEDLINPLAFVSDPLTFNRNLLQSRLKQFIHATHSQEPFVFYDRGMPDVLAYMDYFEQPYSKTFSSPCAESRYDLIFLLPPWKEIYSRDSERFETFEQACEIHDHLERTYTNFGYRVLPVGIGPVKERMRYILNTLKAQNG